MKVIEQQALVIGAGAAGLSAALKLKAGGVVCTVLDREDYAGGILLQCIHTGFGLHHFGQELTGPEFAARLEKQVRDAGVELRLATTVTDISALEDGRYEVTAVSPACGVRVYRVRSVVLAMGSRERNRGNIRIPGDRPAGVFTAGLAQRLLNIDGYLPGKTAVIIGSGDIGLIMARRLTLCGCAVKAVIEIQSSPSGLPRNIAQCLDDFSIPLYTAHATLRIIGRDRVSAIEVAPLIAGVPDLKRAFIIECDTVLLSVGLVPENELSARSGVAINPVTNGPRVNSALMTTLPGVFAAGNVLHIHDLVDWVAEEAGRAGDAAACWLSGSPASGAGTAVPEIPLRAGLNVRYTAPSAIALSGGTTVYLRSMIEMENAVLSLYDGDNCLWQKKIALVRPAEMVSFSSPAFDSQPASGFLEIRLQSGAAS